MFSYTFATGPFLTYRLGGAIAPLVFKIATPSMRSFDPRNYPFSKSLILELKNSLLNKSTVAQIVTASVKYE